MSGSAAVGSRPARRWPLVTVAGAVLLAGLWLLGRASPVVAFDLRSAEPDGYRALALLLEDNGVTVERTGAAELVDGVASTDAALGAVVVARPDLLDDETRTRLTDLAEGGATVVLGTPGTAPIVGVPFGPSNRELADTPAVPVEAGDCELEALRDLGPIDVAFSAPFTPPPEDATCYGDGLGVHVAARSRGAGAVVTLSDPVLWANARLQPDKESGGEPLANGATAVALLGDAATVVLVDPVPSGRVVLDGQQSPLSLLPVGVQLALVQLVVAVVLYVWWRGRRLGPLPSETLPVEIAGSELVVAVGELFRRRRSRARAAGRLRADTRRRLARRCGLGSHPQPAALIEVVAARCGREPDEVGAALFDHLGPPITSAAELVELARTLDSIRQEVLDEPVVR